MKRLPMRSDINSTSKESNIFAGHRSPPRGEAPSHERCETMPIILRGQVGRHSFHGESFSRLDNGLRANS
jgi:hypothetical protein